MNLNMHSIWIASSISTATFITHAGSIRCHHHIIDPGVTEQQLLDACGSPTAREGADLLYKIEGSVPVVVTIGNGVVMFIRDLDESDAAFGEHPFGDRP